jgi:hypothetical protein
VRLWGEMREVYWWSFAVSAASFELVCGTK